MEHDYNELESAQEKVSFHVSNLPLVYVKSIGARQECNKYVGLRKNTITIIKTEKTVCS